MEKLKDFDIHIYKLDNKQYEYVFNVSQDFFSMFEGDFIESGAVKVAVQLDKRENLIELNINFEGYLDFVSDRSLEPFQFPIVVSSKVLYKYGEEEEELEDNVYVVTKSTQTINVAHYIYETIALQVPLKKLHPDEISEDEENDEYIYLDDELKREDDNKENDNIDPRWAALKNLKNKN